MRTKTIKSHMQNALNKLSLKKISINQVFAANQKIDSTSTFSIGSSDISLANRSKLLEQAETIDNLYVGANHSNVKDNLVWQKIYLHGHVNFPLIDKYGNSSSISQLAMPCHNCGIVLPLDCIQVDHHMPQAGGESLYTIKVLRALGLTEGAATGKKFSAICNGVSLNPKGRNRGDYNHLVNKTAKEKWATNDDGALFLSLIESVDGSSDLIISCKNSLLNLVPLCGCCNREKSDWIKPLSS